MQTSRSFLLRKSIKNLLPSAFKSYSRAPVATRDVRHSHKLNSHLFRSAKEKQKNPIVLLRTIVSIVWVDGGGGWVDDGDGGDLAFVAQLCLPVPQRLVGC